MTEGLPPQFRCSSRRRRPPPASPRPAASAASSAAWEAWLSALADPRRAFTVAIFGRDRFTRWDMGRRVLGEHMLHGVIAGGQEGTVAGAPVRTRPGSLLWVPPGTEQVLRLAAGERSFAKFYLRFTIDAPSPPGEPPQRDGVEGALALFAQLYHEHLARLPGRETRMRALLVLLFTAWWRAGERAPLVLDAAQRTRLAELVDRDLLARPAPADLAAALGLSPTWFARLFRRTYGVAPRSWLVQHRIRHAAQRLLDPGRSIGEVAGDYGYGDLFLFSRQFSQVMGCSPRAWRARNR